jgi:hypothetical protein
MPILASGKNWWVNPSFETDVTGLSYSNTTGSRVTTEHWVGDACAEINVTNTSSPYVRASTAQRPNVTVGDDVYFAARVKGPAGKTVAIRTSFFTSGAVEQNTITSSDFTLTGEWQTITAHRLATTGDDTFAWQIRLTNSWSVGNDLYVDGIDIRRNEPLDTYIDGDQGSIYQWSGTAHASTSLRAEVDTIDNVGTGGIIKMRSRLYRADRHGTRIENLAEDIMEGEVSFDQNSEIKMNFKGKIQDITELDPYVDFVIPVLELTYADGSEVEEQLGHYMVVPSTRRYTYTSSDGDIEGRGIEWVLHVDEYYKGYTIQPGNDYSLEVRNALRQAGLRRFNIPNSGKTVPKKRKWEPETKRITVINDLLDSAGFVPLFSGRDGVLRSFKRPNLHRTSSAVQYDAAGQGAELVGVIVETPDMTNFANRVVVVAEDPKRTTIRAVAENRNEASPVSIPRLGFTKTITHKSKNISDEATAQELAERMLERASRHLVKLEIETLPDPSRNPFEVYIINARQEGGNYVATGKYACTGWTIGFTPQQGSMKHKVERMEIYK